MTVAAGSEGIRALFSNGRAKEERMKPVTYLGTEFRTADVARWAVFFTRWGLTWESIREPVPVRGGFYQPDLRLTGKRGRDADMNVHIAVRSEQDDPRADAELAQLFMERRDVECLITVLGPPVPPERLEPQGVELQKLPIPGCERGVKSFVQLAMCPCCDGFGTLPLPPPGLAHRFQLDDEVYARVLAPPLLDGYAAAAMLQLGGES